MYKIYLKHKGEQFYSILFQDKSWAKWKRKVRSLKQYSGYTLEMQLYDSAWFIES